MSEPGLPIGTEAASSSTTRIWPALVAVAIMTVVVAVVGGLLFGSLSSSRDTRSSESPRGQTDDSGSTDVILEPIGYSTESPFAQSSITADESQLRTFADSRRTTPPDGATASSSRSVAGNTALLYGSLRDRPVCDAARLSSMLTADPSVTASWASGAGVAPESVASTVAGLTPVVLTADTAVTNHTYRGGAANSYQSILQAGTPVLIDEFGVPRAQCSCGNPLLPPETPAEATMVGDGWDGFDEERVIEVTRAPQSTATVDTVDIATGVTAPLPLGGDVVLNGVLVADADGVRVLDEASGHTTTVIPQAVEEVRDDGMGGLIYTLARTDSDPETGTWHPPADPMQGVIWHLAAGATDAVPIVGDVAESDTWNLLLAAGTLGGRPSVVYAPLRMETDEYNGLQVANGPVMIRDVGTGASTVLVDFGFGWETATGSISIGGDLLALENGYAAPEWSTSGPDLATNETACSSSRSSSEFIDDNCPREGALDETGVLHYLSGSTDDGAASDEDQSQQLRTIDLRTGQVVAPVDVTGFRSIPSQEIQVDAWNGRLIATTSDDEGSPYGASVIDLTTGVSTRLPVTGAARFLRAPLRRPRLGTAPPQPLPAAPAPAPAFDLSNLRVPAGVCLQYSGDPAPAIDLTDGFGETMPDWTSEHYVSASTEVERATEVDVDGDGTRELVVVINCGWGGSGYTTTIAALGADEAGSPRLVGPTLDEYGRETRAASFVSEARPGELLVHGEEWYESDAACCPSGQFTARWRLQGGAWVESE